MPLGTEVGLGPGDIVLDGNPAPSRKGVQQLQFFGLSLLWTNGRPSQQLLGSCNYSKCSRFYSCNLYTFNFCLLLYKSSLWLQNVN